MRNRAIHDLALLALLFSASAARADEIRLKDGTKISGTIVGFESDSFRVETPYGFALIRKDKVADISISAPGKEAEPRAKGSATPMISPGAPSVTPIAAAPFDSTAAPELVPALEKAPGATAKAGPQTKTTSKDNLKVTANMLPAAAKSMPAPSKPLTAAASASPVVPAAASAHAPPPPPAPPELRDEIRGNLYSNLTYGFQMYKPPSWELIPEARKALPDSIGAMGTYDQTTLLVIGRELAKDSLEAHATATGKTLSGVYENYRLISTRHVTVAGSPAIEQRARGTAAGRDWSVVLMTVLKGNDAFTLLGMTWADSDLIQVQENVITKSINSFTFTAQ